MTSPRASANPFLALAEQASATLRDELAAAGLALEAPTALPAFERAVRAAIAAVESDAPDDVTLDFALAYLTGRIAKEQATALRTARERVNAARAHAERHWRNAIEAERGRRAARAATHDATPRAPTSTPSDTPPLAKTS